MSILEVLQRKLGNFILKIKSAPGLTNLRINKLALQPQQRKSFEETCFFQKKFPLWLPEAEKYPKLQLCNLRVSSIYYNFALIPGHCRSQ